MKTESYSEQKTKRTRSSRAKASVRAGSVLLKSEALREVSNTISSNYYPKSLPTQLFLLNVDPHCLHATWNIRSEDIPVVKLPKSDMLILKLYQQRSGNNEILIDEIQVQGFENAHYIYSLRGAGIYRAEIGILHKNRFITIIRSNRIHVPPPKIRQEQKPWINRTQDHIPAPRQLSLEQARQEAQESADNYSDEHITHTPQAKEKNIIHSISPPESVSLLAINAAGHMVPDDGQETSTVQDQPFPSSHIRRWSVSPIQKRLF